MGDFLGALLAACVAVSSVSVAAPPLVLEKLSTSDGLPQGDVTAVLQDSQGFAWLGTEDGLVRFDGHEIYRYAYSPTTSGGLPGNFIFAIAEDGRGDLWVATKGSGIARWNRRTDNFTVYRHELGNPDSLASNAVDSVLVDNKGMIWIGTLDAGIDILNPASGHIRHLRHDPARDDSLADDEVLALLQDKGGAVWIGTRSGLERAKPDTSGFLHFPLGARPSKPGAEKITQIIEDGTGGLWVGTFAAGLYHIDREAQVVGHFRHDHEQAFSLSNDEVHAVLDDRAGHLWVGTAAGLDLLDRETGLFTHYQHDRTDPNSLSDSFIMSLYQDTAGLVWIGTRAGGLNRWNPHSWELGAMRPLPLDSKLVTAFADAPERRLWIGSVGGGLLQFDPATGESTSIDSILRQRNALGDSRVMSLHEDRRGTLWIGMMADGLKRLADGTIVSVPVHPGDSHSLSAAGIMTIFEARNGALWIGTHGGGANVLDPITGVVRQLPFSSGTAGALSAENITAFVEDRQGNIWIGTDGGGLDLAAPDGSVLKVFKHDPKSARSLSANTIYSLAMDWDGNIWIGTDGGGLDLVVGSSSAPESIQFHGISRLNGLSSDTIYGVLPDSSGHLWLSGNAGLMRYQPATGGVKTYHREHGLQGEEFDFGAYLRTLDGRLCFGGPGGFNLFDPDHLTERSNPPRLALTHLEILGAPVQSATPYWLMKRIELSYLANIVSLDFATLDFTSSNRNQIAYRLSGLTDKWINLGALRRITLTNLEAGDHVLEVRAVNADSVWSVTPYRLAIHKDAAPWRSGVAYAAYGFTISILIALAVRAQRNKLQQALAAQQRLESEVALRTYELRETNQKLVVANEAKGHFLARMGHELRTPMNGVVGMTELLARSPLSTAQARQTQTIRSSAQTLLQVLNDLLDLSKAQAGKIQLETLPVDLTLISEECAALFAWSVEEKGLDLIVCPPPGARWNLLGDPLRIRQILLNIIGNAVKFTERGEIVVRCDVSEGNRGDAVVTVTVSDTGIGMTEEAMARIFEPFTQADETTTRRFGGTGLGLSICHEFAQLMGGSIDVKSVPQAGSTFTVQLRLKTAAQPRVAYDLLPIGAALQFFTRAPALAESLARYLSGMIAGSYGNIDDIADYDPKTAGALVIDADSCPEALTKLERSSKDEHRKLIVIGKPKTLDVRGLETWLTPDQIVRKPVTRECLHSALRLTHQTARDRPTPEQQAAQVPQGRGHVLVVEDDHINAAVAGGYLAELGFTSVWAETGAAAIVRNMAEKFDLILMDLNMPDLDGYATTALIRKSEQQGCRTPIVALTANNSDVYRDSCLLAGMDDILSKPYSFEQCRSLLDRWLSAEEATRGPTAPGTSEQDSASIDEATVASLRRIKSRGAGDLYATLVALFETSSATALKQIDEALSGAKFPEAAAVFHKFKAAAGNVGALAFAALLEQGEQSCIARDAEAAKRLHDRILTTHPLLIRQLKSHLFRAIA